jgi:hypothetical protein
MSIFGIHGVVRNIDSLECAKYRVEHWGTTERYPSHYSWQKEIADQGNAQRLLKGTSSLLLSIATRILGKFFF